MVRVFINATSETPHSIKTSPTALSLLRHTTMARGPQYASSRTLDNDLARRFPPKLVSELGRYCRDQAVSLWSVQGNALEFFTHNVKLVLLHDGFNMGYQRVKEETELVMNLAHTTIEHNVQRLRPVLAEWGWQQVQLGTLAEWHDMGREMRIDRAAVTVDLKMDSADFQAQGSALFLSSIIASGELAGNNIP
jgi:hypothetical protein